MFLNPKIVTAHLPLNSRDRVGDFGSGSGHFAFAAADRIGAEGALYAFDALRASIESLSREAARRNISLHAIHTDLNTHIPLRENALTAGIVANTLHQLTDRERFVDELKRVIEPKGKVLVVDWSSSFRHMGPHPDSVILPGDAARLFTSRGFSVGSMLPAGTHHYAFVAENT